MTTSWLYPILIKLITNGEDEMNILIATENTELLSLLEGALQRRHGIRVIQETIDLWYTLGTYYDVVLIDAAITCVSAPDIARLVRHSGYRMMRIACIGESHDSVFDKVFDVPQNAQQVKGMIERITINDRPSNFNAFESFKNQGPHL